jgi:hypothetical protein
MLFINPALRILKYPTKAVMKAAELAARNPEAKETIKNNYDEFAQAYVRIGKAREEGVIEASEGFIGKLFKDRFNLALKRLQAFGKLFKRAKAESAAPAPAAAEVQGAAGNAAST